MSVTFVSVKFQDTLFGGKVTGYVQVIFIVNV